MAKQIVRHRGRPRIRIEAARVRQLRNQGWTLNEIAQRLGCGRGTVARALAKTAPPPQASVANGVPLADRAAELARSRVHTVDPGAETRAKMREHARHLVYQRWGDGMKVEGQPFPPPDPPQERGNKGWIAVLLIAGGLVLWAIGCPAPL